MKAKPQKLETVTLTIQEIWQQTRPAVHKNKKKYNRKDKGGKKDIGQDDELR